MTLEKRISAFTALGEVLITEKSDFFHISDNPWFTDEQVEQAILAISEQLTEKKLKQWLSMYSEIEQQTNPLKVLVLMAGNIPFVGFQDFISVLITGNRLIGKLSSNDKNLLPLLAEKLCRIAPAFTENIMWVEKVEPDSFDFVIATGSNNSGRYFDYYFGKYPHIIRGHRNSCAILTGNETQEELSGLAKDIFRYFGKGCRSVSKIYVPENYNFKSLTDSLNTFDLYKNHDAYMHNYIYQKALTSMNLEPAIDSGFYLLKENISFASPLSVIYFEKYVHLKDVLHQIDNMQNMLQCVVASPSVYTHAVTFGHAQTPALWDYADGIDIIASLSVKK